MRWWVVALALGACKGGKDEATDGTGHGATTWDDVAPIVESRCTSCHQQGSAAPMSFASADEAAPWAQAIADQTASRAMPPWLVTSDGSCGTFRDSEWLTDEEIATFSSWADGGASVGSGTSITPLPPPTLGDRRDLSLVTPDIVPESEEDIFAPNDEYRCVKFENTTGGDYFLTGYEVVPGNEAIVHHVLAMVVDPDAQGWGSRTNAEEIAEMEAADSRPGWDCLGTAGGYAREEAIPGTWAPGQGAVEFPDGLGVRVEEGDWVVVQIHYNLVDPATIGQSDSTTVWLRTEQQVEHEAYVALPDAFIDSLFSLSPDRLDPGLSSVEYAWDMSGTEILSRAYVDPSTVDTFRLWSVMPHMHQRGRKQELMIKHGGGAGRECAMDVQDWDFEWQRQYFYETPIEVARDAEFQVTCTYDTTDTTSPILPGWGTMNEMCLVVLMLTID